MNENDFLEGLLNRIEMFLKQHLYYSDLDSKAFRDYEDINNYILFRKEYINSDKYKKYLKDNVACEDCEYYIDYVSNEIEKSCSNCVHFNKRHENILTCNKDDFKHYKQGFCKFYEDIIKYLEVQKNV
jgi:hypothetical protein